MSQIRYLPFLNVGRVLAAALGHFAPGTSLDFRPKPQELKIPTIDFGTKHRSFSPRMVAPIADRYTSIRTLERGPGLAQPSEKARRRHIHPRHKRS